MDEKHDSHEPPEGARRTTGPLKRSPERNALLQDLAKPPKPGSETDDPTGTYVYPSAAIEQARLESLTSHLRDSAGQGSPTAALNPLPGEQQPEATHSDMIMGGTGPLAPEPILHLRLPASKAVGEADQLSSCWRVELHGILPQGRVLAVDVLGDVIVGRTREADLDLEALRGPESTISRRHVMLRPTASHLYLIELGSTNGTLYNGSPLTRARATGLNDNDVISLGMLTFTVRITSRPGDERPQ